MQITVRGYGGKQIRLRLPSGLAMNRLSAGLFSASLRDKQIAVSGRQLSLLFSAARKYKKSHPEWKLVEVQARNGDSVEIIL